MYSEIQACMGFLTNFLYNKLPRRKVNLFAEQLANFLVQKFTPGWYPADPHRNANVRCIHVNVDNQVDALISVAASTVGLELEEITKHLPTELTIWVNPGDVSYRVGQCGTMIMLYSARDTSNTVLNRLLSPAPIGTNGPADAGSLGQLRLSLQQQPLTAMVGDPMANGKRGSTSGAMTPVASTPGTPGPIAAGPATPSFELRSPNDLQFTVGSFSMTRFGTTKLRSTPTTADQLKSPKRRPSGGDRFKHE